MAVETGNTKIDLVISLVTHSLDPETQALLKQGDDYKAKRFPLGFIEGGDETELNDKFPGYSDAAELRRELMLAYLTLEPSLLHSIAAQSILLQLEEEFSLN